MLGQVSPYVGDGMLRPAVDSEIWRGTKDGVYKVIDPSLVMGLPLWKWGDLLSFAKAC